MSVAETQAPNKAEQDIRTSSLLTIFPIPEGYEKQAPIIDELQERYFADFQPVNDELFPPSEQYVDPRVKLETDAARQIESLINDYIIERIEGDAPQKELIFLRKLRAFVQTARLISQSGFITYISADRRDNPGFLKNDRKNTVDVREWEQWNQKSGKYTQSVVDKPAKPKLKEMGEAFQNPLAVDETEIMGSTEHFMAKRIEQLLDQRRELEILKEEPVVIMDFGGMLGGSLLRLAQKFEDELDRGEVVVAITNLDLNQEAMENIVDYQLNRAKNIPSPESVSIWEGIQSIMGKVKYVQTSARGLEEDEERTIVRLPEGADFDIRGKVDLIHERMAITAHGFLNDLDFPRLAGLLSENGIMMISRTGAGGEFRRRIPLDSRSLAMNPGIVEDIDSLAKNKLYELYGIEKTPDTDIDVRLSVIRQVHDQMRQAVKNLERMGLKRIECLPYDDPKEALALNYSLFVKPGSDHIPIHIWEPNEDGDAVEHIVIPNQNYDLPI